MHIFKGSEGHVPSCLEIARALRSHFNEDALARMPHDLRAQDLYVAEDDAGEVVGFLSVLAGPGPDGEITWMGVRPDLRGRGIGTALLSRAVDGLVEEGFDSLRVRTLADTVDYEPYEATRAFYRARGFRLEEVIDPYLGWAPGNPCAVYLLDLGM